MCEVPSLKIEAADILTINEYDSEIEKLPEFLRDLMYQKNRIEIAMQQLEKNLKGLNV